MKKLWAVLLTTLFLTSCMEVNTTEPKDAFMYWAGIKAPDGLKVMQGQYWQSAHWTLEYITYLKIKPTESWWDEFLTINNITVDEYSWTKPNDAPTWFTPSDSYVRYKSGDRFDQGSRYFQDTLTGVCYIYEIQL